MADHSTADLDGLGARPSKPGKETECLPRAGELLSPARKGVQVFPCLKGESVPVQRCGMVARLWSASAEAHEVASAGASAEQVPPRWLVPFRPVLLSRNHAEVVFGVAPALGKGDDVVKLPTTGIEFPTFLGFPSGDNSPSDARGDMPGAPGGENEKVEQARSESCPDGLVFVPAHLGSDKEHSQPCRACCEQLPKIVSEVFPTPSHTHQQQEEQSGQSKEQ
jgi:hypothetical protein